MKVAKVLFEDARLFVGQAVEGLALLDITDLHTGLCRSAVECWTSLQRCGSGLQVVARFFLDNARVCDDLLANPSICGCMHGHLKVR